MKSLLVLAAAVLLLVAGWLVTGSWSPSASSVSAELVVPGPHEDKKVLIQAAQQLLKHTPSAGRTKPAVSLLAAITDRVEDQDWPQVQASTFLGWCRLMPLAECRPGLTPLADRLMDRFARFGSAADLETMLSWVHEDKVWGGTADRAFSVIASREVPKSADQGHRLLFLLDVCVKARDYERAGRYATQTRFEEGTSDDVRAPVRRLEQAVRDLFAAKAGQGDFARIVEEWNQDQRYRWANQVLLDAGFQMVRACQETLDFGRVEPAIKASASVKVADQYWASALRAFVQSLPEQGRFAERPALEAMVGAYSRVFGATAFETEFWAKLANENKVDSVPEGMWRAECLKRAARSAPSDPTRVKLTGRVADESLKYGSPDIARRNVEYGTQGLSDEGAKAELAKILARIDAKAAESRALADKAQKGVRNPMAQTRLKVLRTALAKAKTRNDSAEVISGLENEIRNLEKTLPE